MTIVTDKIAAYTAELARVVSVPTGDLAFGSDLSCTDDLTADMAEVPGDSPLAVAQANFRRLTTARGTVPDEPNYGLDVREFLNHGLTRKSLQEIPGQVRGELTKDDRNDASALSVEMVIAADFKSFDLVVRAQAAAGPYSLTLAVSDAGALLKEITGNAG
jgi:hypothetical protein